MAHYEQSSIPESAPVARGFGVGRVSALAVEETRPHESVRPRALELVGARVTSGPKAVERTRTQSRGERVVTLGAGHAFLAVSVALSNPVAFAAAGLLYGYNLGRNLTRENLFPNERLTTIMATGLVLASALFLPVHVPIFVFLGPIIAALTVAGFLWGRYRETGNPFNFFD